MAIIAVYCGSSMPRNEALATQAYEIGRDLAADGHTLLYGCSANGLMGQVARGALDHGGKVKGHVPHGLQRKEPPLPGVELNQCDDVAGRMAAFRTADAHVVLAGGTGTAEEFFHIFNSLCFTHWNLTLSEAIAPCPLALVDDNGTVLRHLWEFVQAGVEEGLVDAHVAAAVRFAPWAEVRGWVNGALKAAVTDR